MENYKVLDTLGRGVQGTAYLVEDRESEKKFVLKKVECSDEAEAHKAFREAAALLSLNHPCVSGYREFFVIWDKNVYAIFLCVVMEYYQQGGLDNVLQQSRSKEECLDAVLLRKWFGEMVESLVYIHENKFIHRDLKPSNIFLKDDLSIAVGDFGISTVMDNVRTLTQTTIGAMNSVAPEVLETNAHYDERTDVWSLGCILLEMTTCGFLDSAQFSVTLLRLKDQPQILDETLDTVAKHYSSDLCQVIRMMMRRAFNQRPTFKELANVPYVQECLALTNSPLYKSGVKEPPDWDPQEAVPEDGGIDAVIAYIQEHLKREAVLLEALHCLLRMTGSADSIVCDGGKEGIVQVMLVYPTNKQLQTLCCRLLGNIAFNATEGDILFTREFIQPVCLAMHSHAGSVELQASASALIMTLAADERASVLLGGLGAVPSLLAALRLRPSSAEVASNCCAALWSLATCESNMAIVTQERGARDICRAMESHPDSLQLVDAACSVLWALSLEDDNLSLLAELGVVELLLKALDKHHEDCGIAKFATAGLCSLAARHDLSAFHVLCTEGGVEGVPVLLKILKTHSRDAEVVGSVAKLFQTLSEHDEIRSELVSLKVDPELEKARNSVDASKDGQNAASSLDVAMATIEGRAVRN